MANPNPNQSGLKRTAGPGRQRKAPEDKLAPVSVSVAPDLLEAVDYYRGKTSRSEWIMMCAAFWMQQQGQYRPRYPRP